MTGFIVLVWAICAIFSAVIASSKGRHSFGWFMLGGLFGVFALFAVGVMPALESVEQDDPEPEDVSSEPAPAPLWVSIPMAALWVGVMGVAVYMGIDKFAA